MQCAVKQFFHWAGAHHVAFKFMAKHTLIRVVWLKNKEVRETYTIHIPVMEKAARLTGRTIQAVIGQSVWSLWPEHEGVVAQGWSDERRDVDRWSHAVREHERTNGPTLAAVYATLADASYRPMQPACKKECDSLTGEEKRRTARHKIIKQLMNG